MLELEERKTIDKYDFDYLVEKINNSDFSLSPFKHIYIEDFFSQEDFDEIISCDEIAPPAATNDGQLLDGLIQKGFKIISFPGCVTDREKYIGWHSRGKKSEHHTACEGFGMVLRLYGPKSDVLLSLDEFLASEKFNRAIARKFDIEFEDCVIDGGIQKYLDGYEISPHPDIRKKAATFMVNINPSPLSESANHHTHYLKLNPEREYVKLFWEGNPEIERVWIPWSWTETVTQQRKNNSIVIFSPTNETLHGVKTDYDHFKTQRTQLYGNIWYKNNNTKYAIEWEKLDLTSGIEKSEVSVRDKISDILPESIKNPIKKVLGKYRSKKKRNVNKLSDDIGQRNI
jgi:hypothetical protein